MLIIPAFLQQRALKQPHLNDMGKKKMRLLGCESIYIHKTPGTRQAIGKLLQLTFSQQATHYMCIVDYHSIKQIEKLSGDKLIKTCMIIFTKYGLPSTLMSTVGKNFFPRGNKSSSGS